MNMTESRPFAAAVKILHEAMEEAIILGLKEEIASIDASLAVLEAAGKLTDNDKKWLLSKVDWAIAEYVPAIEGMVCPGAAMKDRFRALLSALPDHDQAKEKDNE
jgi:hypothetical protein